MSAGGRERDRAIGVLAEAVRVGWNDHAIVSVVDAIIDAARESIVGRAAMRPESNADVFDRLRAATDPSCAIVTLDEKAMDALCLARNLRLAGGCGDGGLNHASINALKEVTRCIEHILNEWERRK